MSEKRFKEAFLTTAFLATVFGVGIAQTVVEWRRGETPQALDLFRKAPTAASLRAYENDLEDASVIAEALRPVMQYAEFKVLDDGGEYALLGRDGWLFYKPDVQYLAERFVNPASLQIGPQALHADDARETAPADAADAIVAFRDALQARGIHLLVVPMPVKASIYPEQLARRAQDAKPPVHEHTSGLIAELARAGVETVDLFETFRAARAESPEPLYLRQDTHWTPEGMALAARTVADRLTALGWVSPGNTEYALRPVEVERPGDIVLMMKSPWIAQCYTAETVTCEQVVDPVSNAPYKDVPGAEVLVLGDSFLRIYQQDEPSAAGFTAHLAHALQQPVESIVNDGGASTLVRQELSRRPALLANKKVVVWEFVERDVRFGTEGWQDVPLPKI
ncbi:MAG: hypothetical protein QG656_258 [Candidatus Hydrogenedentes bacterium]|nr:hypothetical protein [Candidatus Hydrogenedentota bacterium]